MKIAILYPSACQLGESPVWHEERNSCFWVDIERRRIFEYNWSRKSVAHYQLDHRVSLIVPGKDDDLILGLQGGIGKFNLCTGFMSWVTDLGIDWKNHRCNDGNTDSNGRLWVGTMEMNHRKEGGSVYCIDKNKEVKIKIEKVSISNGMAWSVDNKRLYYTDSLTREIISFFYEEDSGEIGFDKIAVRIPEKMGLPDGMAMDEEGMLWVALWGGFGVGRFDVHSGEMGTFIEIPVPNVSSCAFAGKERDHLVITTAREGLTKAGIINYPLSGHVFVVKPGVKGLSGFRCGL